MNTIEAFRIRSRRMGEIGWRVGKSRYWFFACFCPLLVVSGVYAALWWSGESVFSPALYLMRVQPNQLGLTLIQGLAKLGTVGMALSVLAALSEEIVCRGILVPLLAKRFGFAAIIWISWGTWYLYHFPIILWGGYHGQGPLPFELIVFGILLFALTVILTWLRLASGSIWPPVLLHAVHNLLLQSVFNRLTTPNPAGDWVSGEFGVGPTLGYLGVAFWVFTHAWRLTDSRHNEEDKERADD